MATIQLRNEEDQRFVHVIIAVALIIQFCSVYWQQKTLRSPSLAQQINFVISTPMTQINPTQLNVSRLMELIASHLNIISYHNDAYLKSIWKMFRLRIYLRNNFAVESRKRSLIPLIINSEYWISNRNESELKAETYNIMAATMIGNILTPQSQYVSYGATLQPAEGIIATGGDHHRKRKRDECDVDYLMKRARMMSISSDEDRRRILCKQKVQWSKQQQQRQLASV
jgi:hypothetical protein